MNRSPISVFTAGVFCAMYSAPATMGPIGAASALAKTHLEQPDRTREGDPEAWDGPRWIDRNVVSPRDPDSSINSDRSKSAVQKLFHLIEALVHKLRG